MCKDITVTGPIVVDTNVTLYGMCIIFSYIYTLSCFFSFFSLNTHTHMVVLNAWEKRMVVGRSPYENWHMCVIGQPTVMASKPNDRLYMKGSLLTGPLVANNRRRPKGTHPPHDRI